MIPKIEKVAYHEAGHAMASWVLKIQFSEVSIISDDESEGRVTNRLPDSFFDDSNVNRQRRLFEKHILILLAGGLAEEKLTRQEDIDGNASDYKSAAELALRTTGSEAEANAFLLRLTERARNMVDLPTYWAAIEALAAVLLHSKKLSARKAREIMRQASIGRTLQTG